MSGVDESVVTDAVVALLRAQVPSGVAIGDGAPPYIDGAAEDQPLVEVDPDTGESQPTATVYCVPPLEMPAAGYAGQADGTVVLRFQITTAGSQRDAAQALASMCVGILVDRADGPVDRDYVHALSVPAHAIMWRRRAGIVPAASEGGWCNAGGLVDVCVHRTG